MGSSRLILSRIRAAYLVAVLLLVSAATAVRRRTWSAPLPLDPADSNRHAAERPHLSSSARTARPEKRVMLRLAVKAGSIDEDDDQRGLAHMLEHMAFNGSAHFKPGELVTYLESIGARFGPHVNAYTSFDETVYMLDVPTDQAGRAERGFEALSDFAGGVTLDPTEIDRERGVVIEEWRGRLGAGTRMQEPQMKALFGDIRYVDRDCRSARPRCSGAFRPSGCATSIATTIGPTAWRSSSSATSIRPRSRQLIRKNFSALARRPAAPRTGLSPIPPHAGHALRRRCPTRKRRRRR